MFCKKCKQTLPIDLFYKDKYTKRGYKSNCKNCSKKPNLTIITKPLATVNPEPIKEQNVDTKSENSNIIDSKKVNNIDEIIGNLKFIDKQFNLKETIKKEDAFKELKNPAIAIFGSRRAGKTTLIKKIFPLVLNKCDFIVFFCGSIHADIYKELKESPISKKCSFIEDFNENIIGDIFAIQKYFKNILSIGLVFDDESDLSAVKNSRLMLKVYNKGRNHNITIIDAKHGAAFLNKNNRGNLDIAIFMKLNTPDLKLFVVKSFLIYNIPDIDEKYFLKRSDYEELCFKIYSKNTENIGDAMYINFVKENKLMKLN